MATASVPATTEWTAQSLFERFGPIPLARVVTRPRPGTATIDDVIRLEAQENRLCELVDGVLLEKVMGFIESLLALRLGALLTAFVTERKLGITAGEAGMLRILPDQVRIPDVSFISWDRLEGSGFPEQAAPDLAPDLAVEVLSAGNTEREMRRKLDEYFEAGVRLVWYIDPATKTVTTYTTPEQSVVLTVDDKLTGGEVLPGFEASLRELFATPTRPV
ncbi:MAG: Uma2 family endonuclease [Lacipirellulaceae bacterium]